MPSAEQLQQAQQIQQAQAAAQQQLKLQQLDSFMLSTISQIYARLVAKHGDEVPLETLAEKAQIAAQVLGFQLGILKPAPEPHIIREDIE